MSHPQPMTDSWHLASLSSSSAIPPKADHLDPWSPTDSIAASSSQAPGMPVFGYPQAQPSMSELVHPMIGKSLGGGGFNGKGKEKEMGLTNPRSVAVLADVMDSSKGRDKVLKCAQYSLKTYLYLLSLVVRIRPLSPWFKSNRKRVGQAVSSLSLTRKCLLLLNPLHPLSHLLSPEPTSATTLLRHLLDLASALSDDIFCLSRLGLINRRLGKSADKWSNRFWFLTTIMGLYKLHLTTLPRLRSAAYHISEPESTPTVASRRALSEAEWTNRKLLADLVFVSYDVFNLSWFEEPVKCFAGLTAAVISTTKIYDQHWRANLGKG